jgi:RNA polymerase sigma-70 factor, ECF subfamily
VGTTDLFPAVLYLTLYLFLPRTRNTGIKLRALRLLFRGLKKGFDVLEAQDRVRFEESVLPHLDAAFNLARWIVRSRADAEDVTQEALLRAFRFFGSYRAGDARAWLLQIVRNCCYSWLRKNRPSEDISELSETSMPQERTTPESLAIANCDREWLARALEELPAPFREILVLRELEGCSYKQIAAITARPIGTVMSGLARARQQLRIALSRPAQNEVRHGM